MNWDSFWFVIAVAGVVLVALGFVAFWAWLMDYIGIWAPIIGSVVLVLIAAITAGLVT